MAVTGARAARIALAAMTLSSCAVTTPAADPFAPGSGADERPRTDARPVRVRLEVVCNNCAITYEIAGRIMSAGATSPIWRWTLDRYPRFPESIRLTAAGEVDRVRIYVNGEVVAFEEGEPGDMNVVLRAETVIPLETSPPDTLPSQRAPGLAPG